MIEEIENEFYKGMKLASVQQVLIKSDPDNRWLVDEPSGPPPAEPLAHDFSGDWHESFVENRAFIEANLHQLDPAPRKLLDFCYRCFGNVLLLDMTKYSAEGTSEFEGLKGSIIIEISRMENVLMREWFPVAALIVHDRKEAVPFEKRAGFFNCIDILVSLQLKDLILRSLKHFQAVFVHGNSMDLPEIRLELAVDETRLFSTHPKQISANSWTLSSTASARQCKRFQNLVTGWRT
ncbi:dynein heavy chain 12, axonemal-like isoform X2 [Pomacea canaliculata]|uniref:dynein heavy chain 12, axonemal-like isoform X2 n=1 Tax=Pomacea canaliculata TaxID=400727 RepID=UPI000D735048|nr:dynein heavy chain 12, axonemal-like isoform X2 [Pomacea canaliculata]